MYCSLCKISLPQTWLLFKLFFKVTVHSTATRWAVCTTQVTILKDFSWNRFRLWSRTERAHGFASKNEFLHCFQSPPPPLRKPTKPRQTPQLAAENYFFFFNLNHGSKKLHISLSMSKNELNQCRGWNRIKGTILVQMVYRSKEKGV